MELSNDDLEQFAEADRREVDPPIQVETATWSTAANSIGGVKERQEWWGRVRGADGRQRWIRAVDLRPAGQRDCWCHGNLPRERFKGPRNTAGLRSSLGRSTFHCINMNSRPDCMKAPAEPDGAPQSRRPL